MAGERLDRIPSFPSLLPDDLGQYIVAFGLQKSLGVNTPKQDPRAGATRAYHPV